mmetsp:Transcript_16164/g.30546  ORF Transcript_16164/g.30546 Transcript_16164/m.30546 type:complete len:418 (+) Transcript_16164:181-1434(+)
MRFKAVSLICCLFVAMNSAAGFLASPPSCSRSTSRILLKPSITSITSTTPATSTTTTTSSSRLEALSTPEEYAKILTNYMARAHEEKLKALDVLEKKKNSEIAALQQQLDDTSSLSLPPSSSSSQSSSLVTSSSSLSSLSSEKDLAAAMQEIEALTQKVNMYQKFIADYVIKAQAEKDKAVKEAELALEKKYQEKLNAFLLNPSSGMDSSSGSSGSDNDETMLYRMRNAKITSAASAGISRWGNKELKRVGATVLPHTKTIPMSSTNASVATESGSSVIEEADHGMRADGGVGGPSLADRVVNGASAVSTGASASSPSSSTGSLYEERNAKIAKAASSGISTRWGNKEVAKVMDNVVSNGVPAASIATSSSSSSATSSSSSAQVEAANHGMRADGGVGGPSLAERVNLGATMLKGME